MSPPREKALMHRNLRRGGIVAVCLFGAVLLAGGYTRFVEARDLKTWTRQAEIPTVALVSPQAGGKGPSLVLPGTLEAFYDAKLYSRVPGYVRAWYRDIG